MWYITIIGGIRVQYDKSHVEGEIVWCKMYMENPIYTESHVDGVKKMDQLIYVFCWLLLT